MSLSQPFEGLLRSPLEWYTTFLSLAVGDLLWEFPSVFVLPQTVTRVTLGVLGLLALYRFLQGCKVWRYQRRLKRMPTYTVSSKEIPKAHSKLFLGKGFLWKTQHTQRLRDLDLDYHQRYKYPSRAYEWARLKETQWENHRVLKPLANFLKSNSRLNPIRAYPKIGGLPCVHGVGDRESNIVINSEDRGSHMIVLGQTGMGKTRLAEILITQDIHRGDVVIVLDPKGDVDLLQRICSEAQLAGRENDLRILHFGFPHYSCRYNPIGQFTKLTQIATRLTNGLPSSGEAASFKEFAWKYTNLVARALSEMGMKPTYKLIQFYITKLDLLFFRYIEKQVAVVDPDFEDWLRDYQRLNSRNTKDNREIIPTREAAIFAYVETKIAERNLQEVNALQNDLLIDLFAACKLDKTYYDKITASIGPLLEKLTTGELGEVLSPNYTDIEDQRPILDWLSVIRKKQIVYIGMDALTDPVVASSVGNAMLSDLASVAGYLYKFGLAHGFPKRNQPLPLPRIILNSDEFNEVIGDEFVPLLNKARGAGFNVIAYTQTWSDVEARLMSSAKAEQVAGNLGTLVMFRCNEIKTIEYLTHKLPMVPVMRAVPASSSQDSAHGEQHVFYTSSNEDRFAHHETRLVEATDILNLPKGQAFCLLEGGKLYKIRVPLPKATELHLSHSLIELMQHLRQSTSSSM